MKLKFAATVTGLCAWGALAAAAPDVGVKPVPAVAPKPLEMLIHELSDEQYKVREQATTQLWAMGGAALHALEETAAGDDPEQIYRAKELIHKIEMDITPETDPSVAALVERFAKATANERSGIFGKLRRLRAWRQILKLYATETSPEQQGQFEHTISEVALTAARECILENRPDAAREYLEMAPADAPGLLALADFHRSQGTLDAELKRALTLNGPKGAAWQLALYRASGNLKAARDVAAAAGEPLIFASLSALLGDPVPWLRTNDVSFDGTVVPRIYSDLAIKRWQGNPLRATDLEPLTKDVNARNQQFSAVDCLFLLGETDLAKKGLLNRSKADAFTFYDKLEAIPEALETLGLDPEKPDYTAWVAKHFELLTVDGGGNDRESARDVPELVLLANFLEVRGLDRQAQDAFLKPLAAIAGKDPKEFTDFLTTLFGGNSSTRGQTGAAPELARAAATAWAGDDADRWLDVVDAAFGSQEGINTLWAWLAELDPKARGKDRFDGIFSLLGMGRDPHRLR